jgi:hypothetical protein
VPNGSATGGILCGLVAGVAIGTFIGAVILRNAIGLYNVLAGKDRVPTVSMGHAMLITFATSVINVIVTLLIARAGVAGAGFENRDLAFVNYLIGVPVSLVIMAGMLSMLLPTTIGRAFLVTLCHTIIVFVLIVLGVAIYMACVSVRPA